MVKPKCFKRLVLFIKLIVFIMQNSKLRIFVLNLTSCLLIIVYIKQIMLINSINKTLMFVFNTGSATRSNQDRAQCV